MWSTRLKQYSTSIRFSFKVVMILTTPTPLFNDTRPSREYFAQVISGKQLLESCKLDTTNLEKLMANFTYRHGVLSESVKEICGKSGI